MINNKQKEEITKIMQQIRNAGVGYDDNEYTEFLEELNEYIKEEANAYGITI